MPAYRSIPLDAYIPLSHEELLTETVFLPGVVKVVLETGMHDRTEHGLLVGWMGVDRTRVFLSPEGMPCILPGWTVRDIAL